MAVLGRTGFGVVRTDVPAASGCILRAGPGRASIGAEADVDIEPRPRG